MACFSNICTVRSSSSTPTFAHEPSIGTEVAGSATVSFGPNSGESRGDGSSTKFIKISITNKPHSNQTEDGVDPYKKIHGDSEESTSKTLGKASQSHTQSFAEKCVVFIRDVPNVDRPRLCKLLVDRLQERNIYPVYVYSLMEILKYPQNIERIRKLGLRERWKTNKTKVCDEEIPEILTKGCSVVLSDLFHTSLHNPPNLIVIDYMSESLVDMEETFELARWHHYNIFMLKQYDPLSKIDEIVNKISKLIISLDVHHVTHLQERDMWWHEPSGLYIPHLLPGHHLPYAEAATEKQNEEESIFERFLRSTLDELRFLEKPKPVDLPGVADSPNPDPPKEIADDARSVLTKTEEFLSQATQKYIDKLKEILPELQKLKNLAQVKIYFDLHKNPEVQLIRLYESKGRQLSLAIIRDCKSLKNPTHRRLYNIFVEEALSKSFMLHAIPCGELVASSEFGDLVTEFAVSIGILDTITAYSTIFLGLFQLLIQKHEKVIALDSIDSRLIGIDGFLQNAKENKIKVHFCERNKDGQSAKKKVEDLLILLEHRHGH